MKQDSTRRRVRTGYAILAALLLSAVLIFYADRIANWFRGYIDVVAIVYESRGVRVGSPVRVAGVEAGHVTGVGFVEHEGVGAVAVDVRLDEDVRNLVRRGSLAHTALERFVGSAAVRISAGPPESPPIENGDTVYPAARASLQLLMERAEAFPRALDSLTSHLSEIQRLAQSSAPRVAALTDRLTVALDEAATLRSQLDGGGLQLWLEDPELPRRIRQLRESVAEVSDAAAGLERYRTDGELGEQAAALMARSERVSASLAELERRLAGGRGFLIRAQRDSAIEVAIGRVQAQIDSLRAEGLGFALRMFLP